jgi:hypothetical protein
MAPRPVAAGPLATAGRPALATIVPSIPAVEHASAAALRKERR